MFVTFRLSGSLPREIQRQLRIEANRIDRVLAHITDPTERAQRAYLEQRRMFGKWDKALDLAHGGPFWLREPRVAQLVINELHGHRRQVYDLEAFCVMPNHVHVVYTPLDKGDNTYYSMSTIMHSLKGRSAIQANPLLNRRGEFWQHENYDHVVRDEAEKHRVIRYILNNPVKAGLAQDWQAWPWSYCKYQLE